MDFQTTNATFLVTTEQNYRLIYFWRCYSCYGVVAVVVCGNIECLFAVEKDDLNLDKTSNVVGIDPRLLAAADEEFLIYSPTKSSYVFMSKDPSLAAMMHTKLEVKSNRDSQRNFFKLIKIHEEDAFYLKNTKTEKFVYISGEHVLGMTGDPSEHEDKSKFVFQFEAIDGNACYKIKNGKHYLFVSKTTSGIPPNHVIHTSTEADNEANIFQFVLEKVNIA